MTHHAPLGRSCLPCVKSQPQSGTSIPTPKPTKVKPLKKSGA